MTVAPLLRVAVVALLLTAVTACGGSDDSAGTPAATTTDSEAVHTDGPDDPTDTADACDLLSTNEAAVALGVAEAAIPQASPEEMAFLVSEDRCTYQPVGAGPIAAAPTVVLSLVRGEEARALVRAAAAESGAERIEVDGRSAYLTLEPDEGGSHLTVDVLDGLVASFFVERADGDRSASEAACVGLAETVLARI